MPHVSAAQVEAAQAQAFRRLRGEHVARARPALGFALSVTTRAEVEAWAHEHGVRCEPRRDGALLLCADVPASALSFPSSAAYEELAFGFRLRDLRLVNLTALRTGLTPDGAAEELGRITAGLERSLGSPARKIEGDPAVLTYRHADYLADVSAMSLRGRGHVLREHYMSALE